MKKVIVGGAMILMSWIVAVPAYAHVTVQPTEAPPGSFYRFNVRVPNERDDASTTKVEVQFPPLTNVSFQPKAGWNMRVRMTELDEPIEVFGEEVTEAVGSVTWSGGSIEPGEFDEFGFSVRTPDEAGELEFAALQTYSSGEVVEWTGAPDSDTPAARVTLVDVGFEEGQGELGLLADLKAAIESGAADGSDNGAAEEDEGDGSAPAAAAEESDDDSNLGVVLGAIGIGLGVVAIGLALRRGRA